VITRGRRCRCTIPIRKLDLREIWIGFSRFRRRGTVRPIGTPGIEPSSAPARQRQWTCYLLGHGRPVDRYEKRPDPRRDGPENGDRFNWHCRYAGLQALRRSALPTKLGESNHHDAGQHLIHARTACDSRRTARDDTESRSCFQFRFPRRVNLKMCRRKPVPDREDLFSRSMMHWDWSCAERHVGFSRDNAHAIQSGMQSRNRPRRAYSMGAPSGRERQERFD